MNNPAATNQSIPFQSAAVSLDIRVARLATPVRVLASGYRRLDGNTPDSLLCGLLSEVDETVLPRRIHVVTDAEQTVVLRVSARRLLGLSRPNGPSGQTLAEPSPIAELCQHLQDIFAGATRAAIQSSRAMADKCLSPESGSTVSALAEFMALDLSSRVETNVIPGFFDDLSVSMVAWVLIGPSGQAGQYGGDPSWVDRLDDLVRDGLTDIDMQLIQSLPKPELPGCILLRSGGRDGLMLVYARSRNGGFIALVPAREMPRVQPMWQRYFG